MTDVTGYSNLVNGQVFQAIITFWDSYLSIGGVSYFIFILFMVFKAVILIKTESAILSAITSIFFVSLAFVYLPATVAWVAFFIAITELAGVLYYIAFK